MIRLAAVVLACGGALHAGTEVQRLLEERMLGGRVHAIAESIHGVLGVAAIDLRTGRVFAFNGDAEFPTASTIKVAIMAEMFRQAEQGRFRLDSQVTVSPAERVGGCIKTAGMDQVNRLLAESGMRAMHLRRIMMDTAAATKDEENTTSPLEMARLVEMLYRGRLAAAATTEEMIGLLKRVDADVRKAIPPAIPVASKPGDLTGVHCEVALVYLPERPFIVSIYSSFLEDNENPVPAVATAAFEYFSTLASSNAYGNRVR